VFQKVSKSNHKRIKNTFSREVKCNFYFENSVTAQVPLTVHNTRFMSLLYKSNYGCHLQLSTTTNNLLTITHQRFKFIFVIFTIMMYSDTLWQYKLAAKLHQQIQRVPDGLMIKPDRR